MLGWFKDRNAPGPRRLIPTDRYPEVYDQLCILLRLVTWTMMDYLPEYWKEHVARVKGNQNRVMDGEFHDTYQRHSIPMNDEDYPLFSTVTVNRNTTCRAHTDAKNKRGLACMTTFGNFRGGDLCFPRLGVRFDVQPGDLLIADTNRELHGNRRERRGDRISVVAYLRELRRKP